MRMLEIHDFLVEAELSPIFTIDNIDEFKRDVLSSLQKIVPSVRVSHSTLGGKDRVSIFIHLSLDPQTEWANNIFHNSRYGIFVATYNGVLEMSSSGMRTPKFRKSRFKNAKDLTSKIQKWINKA